jgi:uncharacterized protein
VVATTVELEESIRSFANLLKERIRLEALILYGSYARGNAYDDSDIDIAVISPDFERLPVNRRQEIIAEFSVHRDRRITPIGYPSSEYHNPGPQSFLREIIETGRVVYDGKSKNP